MKTSFLAFLLAVVVSLGACAHTFAPGDYPILPTPDATVLEPVDGVRTEGGILLDDEAFRTMVRNLKELEGERDLLRSTIEEYNEWVRERTDDEE